MPVQKLDDPVYVAEQYATEVGLAARKAIYADISGPNARDVALEAALEQQPTAVLEVGCGEGELAEQIAAAAGINVVAVDLSPRMVEVTAARGVDARVADVRHCRSRMRPSTSWWRFGCSTTCRISTAGSERSFACCARGECS